MHSNKLYIFIHQNQYKNKIINDNENKKTLFSKQSFDKRKSGRFEVKKKKKSLYNIIEDYIVIKMQTLFICLIITSKIKDMSLKILLLLYLNN